MPSHSSTLEPSAPVPCAACGDYHGSVRKGRHCLVTALLAVRQRTGSPGVITPGRPHLCVGCGHYHGSVNVELHCLRRALASARTEATPR